MNVNQKWNTKMMMIKNANSWDIIYTVWIVIKNLIRNSKDKYKLMNMLIKTVLKSEQTIIIFFYNFYNTIKRIK